MRTAGKGYDEFYQRILEEGGIFVRGKVGRDHGRGPHPGGRGQAHRPGRGHARRQAAPLPGRHGHPVGRPRAARRRQGAGHAVRHLVQLRRLGHREAPQARPGRDHDRGRVHRRLRAGPQGHPGLGRAGRGGGRPRPGPDPAEADEPRADQGHGSRRAMLRLPHLQHDVPVQRHQLRRRQGRLEHQPGDVPGLRHLRRRLPRRSDLRVGLQRRAGPGPDRGPAPSRSRRGAAQAAAFPEAHHDAIEEAVRA